METSAPRGQAEKEHRASPPGREPRRYMFALNDAAVMIAAADLPAEMHLRGVGASVRF